MTEHVRDILKKMIVLNPKSRAKAKNLIEDRYFSNFLSGEKAVVAFYHSLAREHRLELRLDDNALYELKSYEEELLDFVDEGLLKQRRFLLKDAHADFRLHGLNGESRERERADQSNVDIKSQMSPGRHFQEDHADELERSKGTEGARLSHGKNSLRYRGEE